MEWRSDESCGTCGWLSLEGTRCRVGNEGIDCAGDGNGCYRSRFATRMMHRRVVLGWDIVGISLKNEK